MVAGNSTLSPDGANVVQVKFAELLHKPVFVAGKSLGPKLDPMLYTGLVLEWDLDERELLVHWNGEVARMPKSGVHSYHRGVAPSRAPAVAVAKASIAQVDSPTSHVFAGPGKGKK